MNTNNTTSENIISMQADYLQADSEVKDLVTAVPAAVPVLSSYGGEDIPRSMVIVQGYTISRQMTEGTNTYQYKQQQAKDNNGKLLFAETIVTPEELNEHGEVISPAIYAKKPVFTEKKVLKQIRQKVGERQTINTLQVIPLRAKVQSNELHHVLGANMNELFEGLTIGKQLEFRKEVTVNGEKIERIYKTTVKTGLKKGAICHLFYREGNNIFSTITVNGGVKGSELINDFSAACSKFYKQIKAAKEAGKTKEISSVIATALNLTPMK